MQAGVLKAELLGQRMENVREKVREQERREGEWVGRVRRRVRWCWGAAGVFLMVCVGVMVVRHWPKVERGMESGEQVVGRFANRTIEGLGWEATSKRDRPVGSSRAELVEQRKVRETDHPVLRMLDEL